MNYTDVTELTSVKEMENLLKSRNIKEFAVYVEYYDSIYAVTGLETGYDVDFLYVNTEETYGAGSRMTASEFLTLLENECGEDDYDIICTAPDNIDPELDCQMTEDMALYAVAVDKINKDVILLVK